MLEVKKSGVQAECKGYKKPNDIIVKRLKMQTKENEDGSITIKPVYTLVNITKKIQETAKLIKTYTAEEKLAEIEKVFSKNKEK